MTSSITATILGNKEVKLQCSYEPLGPSILNVTILMFIAMS
jgi:hypothetical protein